MNKRNVLFVDDEPNILSSLSRLLRKEDYRLLTASSGKEAFNLLEKEIVHVVISDQKMPEMTGTEFLQKVKERFPDTIRVVLSGDADVNTIVESINKDEIYRFLTKPWNDEELKIAIRQCLAYYDLIHENRNLLARVKTQNEELHHLNEGLENTVRERTQSLRLSQSILDKLPVPVLGVSQEGMIVLVNQAVASTFSFMRQFTLGSDMREIFPESITKEIESVLMGNLTDHSVNCDISGRQMRLRMMSLRDHGNIRGCILMVK